MSINLKRSLKLFTLTALLLYATTSQVNSYANTNDAGSKQKLADVFESEGIEATLVVVSSETGTRHVYNPSRSNKRFSPASTFKVLNTLIALQSNVVESAESEFKWDGIDRVMPSWNRDQTLRSAFRVSCVWCYQEIARNVGKDRYKEALKRHDFGNNRIGDQVDLFWLNGELKISSVEQVQLLAKIADYSINIQREHIDTLRSIMLVEKTDEYSLYGKTGWTGPERHIGWYVGFVEKGNKRWLFAMNMEMDIEEQADLRKQLTIRALQTLGIL